MPHRLFALFALLGAASLLSAASAGATSLFTNGLLANTDTRATGPWTASNARGFASSQGSPSGDGTGLSVHARATSDLDTGIAFESIIMTEINFSLIGFGLVDVTVTGTYLLEVFGKGSVLVEAWLCQGVVNQCQVNQDIVAPLATDSILSNLSPTSQVKREMYSWTGQLNPNNTYTLKLMARASALTPNSQTRAFVDPTFTVTTEGGSVILDSPAQIDNPDYIAPPVPEPGIGLLLGAGLLAVGGRRAARRWIAASRRWGSRRRTPGRCWRS